MPTVRTVGVCFGGSAFGSSQGGDNSKRDAGISGVALFRALSGEYVGCGSVGHFRASCATARTPNGGVRSEDTRFLFSNVHHSFSGSRGGWTEPK